MDRPDFSIVVDQPEGVEEKEVVPQIKPKNVSIVESAKPLQPTTNVTNTVVANTVANAYTQNEVLEPVVLPSSTMAETIEIPHPQSIFPHIEPFPEASPKQHHFRLKHKTDQARLIQSWRSIDPAITVMINSTGNQNVDVTLMRGDQSVGKIQFLHFDRRDRKIRSKHYVKVYLYQFEDSTLFEKSKQIMIEFFQSIQIKPHRRSHKRVTHKKRAHRRVRKSIRRPHHS